MNFEDFKTKYEKKKVLEVSNQISFAPLLSVMVQTFQHKNYIRDCLDNILNQKTDFTFEILLGEDGSSDGTRKICLEYASRYPDKIRLFLHHPDNKIKVLRTITGNFNALYNFFSAKGEYIAFCEGDDLWTDNYKLQKQVDTLRLKSNMSLVFHAFKEVNEKQQPISGGILDQRIQDISGEDLKKLNFHPLLSTVCFRNGLKGLPNEIVEVINVDSFLFSLLGNHGNAGFMGNISPTFYRRHKGGTWSRRKESFKYDSKIETYRKLRRYYEKNNNKEIADHFKQLIKKVTKMKFFALIRRYKIVGMEFLRGTEKN